MDLEGDHMGMQVLLEVGVQFALGEEYSVSHAEEEEEEARSKRI